MADDAAKSLPLHLAWIGVLCGALLLLLGDLLPVRMTFVRPETLFLCLAEVEIAFLVFVWPLFLPAIAPADGTARSRARRALREGALLGLSSLPLALIAANLSNVEVGDFLAVEALLAALMALPAVLRAAAPQGGAVYVLAALTVSALLPFLRFLAGPAWNWMSRVSPFWAAGNDQAAWAAAIYGGLAVALLGWTLPRDPGRIAA